MLKKFFNKKFFDWNINLIETGRNTMTGGRLKRLKKYIGNETFMMTYGEGVADINLNNLIKHHKEKDQMATLTAVQPGGRFGAIKLDDNNNILQFQEKPEGDGAWINGGFFVLKPEIFNYLDDDSTIFERKPLESLAHDGQLNAYHHRGFWMPMDKLSDKISLEEMWNEGKAKWKIWK